MVAVVRHDLTILSGGSRLPLYSRVAKGVANPSNTSVNIVVTPGENLVVQ
jgi:hypothetical protein